MMYKKIIEIRPNKDREFKDESAEYLANERIKIFNDNLVEGGIVKSMEVSVSEDGLTKTKTFEIESVELFDALRECFFPSNQSYSYMWETSTGHQCIEEPPYNFDIVGKELEDKFANFIITYYH